MKKSLIALILSSSALLSACGGGGSSDAPTTQSPDQPIAIKPTQPVKSVEECLRAVDPSAIHNVGVEFDSKGNAVGFNWTSLPEWNTRQSVEYAGWIAAQTSFANANGNTFEVHTERAITAYVKANAGTDCYLTLYKAGY